jgi:hypothetical protein
MGVLLSSEDLRQALGRLITRPSSIEELLVLCEPIVEITSKRFPIYMRDDLKQEIRIDFANKAPALAQDFKNGGIKDVMSYVFRVFSNAANDYAQTEINIECKLVRIDDIQLEVALFPKTYEKSKIIKKIQNALEHFYKARYPEDGYAERASRFAYIMLAGKRPNMTTNNLQRFFNGNRIHAQLAYTTALIMIKRLLEVNGGVE